MHPSKWLGLCLVTFSLLTRAAPPDGGRGLEHLPGDSISTIQRARIDAKLARNVAELERVGKLHSAPLLLPQQGNLQWPLRQAAGFDDPGYSGVSNFVDLDPAYPDQVQDWTCGTRTYDLSEGYNHAGIDYFTWPFGWRKMDQGAVEIVAAAPGTIIGKVDGNNDRSCPNHYSDNWNAVYIQHADGSVAWYGHMKKDSLTNKSMGDTVTSGEFLGKVGSAGFSSGPHLHFEIHSALSAYQILEPHSGTCNDVASLWATQRPYYDSAINKLATQSAPPDFHGDNCPNPVAETPHFENHFMPGETAYFAAYYRDQRGPQPTEFTILRPDDSVFAAWTFRMSESTTDPFYAASYWYWVYNLPNSALIGVWHFRASFEGVIYEHAFTIGDLIFAHGFE